jgi:hypothetical protein
MLLAVLTTIQKIEPLFRRFLWEGGKQTGRKLHLISSEKVTKTFSEGDLPFKNINAQNLAVTPCFPQIVNITELAKDYGKNS